MNEQFALAVREMLQEAGIRATRMTMTQPAKRTREWLQVIIKDGPSYFELRTIDIDIDNGELKAKGTDYYEDPQRLNLDLADPKSFDKLVEWIKRIVGTGDI